MAIEAIPEIIETTLDLEALHTLEVTFTDGQTKRWAGKNITIAGATYEGGLVRCNPFRRALGGTIDRIDVEIENLDYSHSLRVLNNQSRKLARAVVGQLFRNLVGGGWVWQVLFRGVVGQPYTTTSIATYSVISDLAAAPNVGATAIVMRNCRWRYKDSHCASPSTATTCDKTFHLPTGCLGRGPSPDSPGGNQWRFAGVVWDISKATLLYPAPDPNPPGGGGGGGVGGGDDGGRTYPDLPY